MFGHPASSRSSRSAQLKSIVGKALSHRSLRRRRSQNATFAGTPSTQEDGNRSPPPRELSQTFCCTPPPPPLMENALASSSVLLESPSSASSLSSPCSRTSSSTPLPQNLRVQGWMYWARPDGVHNTRALRRRKSDPTTAGDSFTKVFAVLRNEFLLLYRSQHKFARFSAATEDPLVHIAVSRVTRMESGAFLVEDPQNNSMELHVYDRRSQDTVDMWAEAFAKAAQLTAAHFSSFSIKADELPRSSMYRGSLHDLREQQKPRLNHLRASFTHSVSRLSDFRPFASSMISSLSHADDPERDV